METLLEANRCLRDLGRRLYAAREAPQSRRSADVFAEIDDWTAVAFEMVEETTVNGSLTGHNLEDARRALDGGAFRKATPYFSELLA
jgi:hypothetical protein